MRRVVSVASVLLPAERAVYLVRKVEACVDRVVEASERLSGMSSPPAASLVGSPVKKATTKASNISMTVCQ